MAENQEQQYIIAPQDIMMQQPTSTKNRQVIYRPVQSINGPPQQQFFVQKHPSQSMLQQVYSPQPGQRFVPMQQNPNKMYQAIPESGARTITVQREVQVEKQVPVKKEVEAFDTVVETVPIVEEIPIIETIIQPVQVPAYKSIVYPLKQSQYPFQPQQEPQQPQQQQQPQYQEQQPPKEIIKTEIVYKTQMVDNPEHLKKIEELESKIQNLEEEVEDHKKEKRTEQAKRSRKQQEDQQQQRDLENKVRELDEQFQRINMEKEFIMRQLETAKNQNQDLYSNNLELNLAIENLAIKLTEFEKNLSVKTIELSEEETKNRKLQDQYNDVLQHIVILGIENERLHLIIREGTEENEKLRQSQKIVVKGIVPRQSSQQTIQAIQNQVRQSINPQAFQNQLLNSTNNRDDGFKQRNTVASGGVFSQAQFPGVTDQKQFQYASGDLQKSQFSQFSDKQNKIVFDNHHEKKQYKQQK